MFPNKGSSIPDSYIVSAFNSKLIEGLLVELVSYFTKFEEIALSILVA